MAKIGYGHMTMVSLATTLHSELGDIADDMADEVRDVLEKQAGKIAETAKNNAPVGGDVSYDPHRGRLKESISVIDADEGNSIGFRVIADARDDKGVPYAHMVEYGTEVWRAADPKRDERPFLLPAFEEHLEETVNAVSDTLDNLG